MFDCRRKPRHGKLVPVHIMIYSQRDVFFHESSGFWGTQFSTPARTHSHFHPKLQSRLTEAVSVCLRFMRLVFRPCVYTIVECLSRGFLQLFLRPKGTAHWLLMTSQKGWSTIRGQWDSRRFQCWVGDGGKRTMKYHWLVGGLEHQFYFPIYWE